MAKPWTAAMVIWSRFSIAAEVRLPRPEVLRTSSSLFEAESRHSLVSAPEEKTPPSPVRMTTRVSKSSAS